VSSNQPVRYDESKWPVLMVTLPAQELLDGEIQAHLERMSSFTRRGSPYVQVIDVRVSPSLSAPSRRLVAERLDHDDEAHPGVLLGVGIVLATSLHRGIFKALSWLSRSQRPFESFTEVEEAVTWARRLANAPVHSMTLPVATDISKRTG